MSEIEKPSDVAALAVQLLSAYLSNNSVPSEDLAALIRSTKAALTEDAPVPAEPETTSHTPAVSVRKSLASPDHIISLIDGKAYKVLKRHLATHGLTPDSYRERYNLPASYPMVAPTFAAHRRAIAEKIGLGSRKPVAAPVAEAKPAVEATASPAAGKVKAKPQAKAAKAPAPTPAPAAEAKATPKRAAKSVTAKGPKPAVAKPKADSEAGGTVTAAAPATAKAPKPRGKLGLFGKADAKAEPTPKVSAKSEEAAPASTATPATPKPVKQKRMARAPKAVSAQAAVEEAK